MEENLNKKKKCPRCGYKMYQEVTKCQSCGLSFARIQNLSNQSAKKLIRQKNKKNVLYVNVMPKDVNKARFILFFVIFGWFGAHNIYIGKYKRGWYSLITGVLSIIGFGIYEYMMTIDTSSAFIVLKYFTNPAMLFFTFGIIVWFYDLLKLTMRQYKYPASLTQDDLENVLREKMRG